MGSKSESERGKEIFEKLLNGEPITEEIHTPRGSFTIKFPVGADFVEIDRKKAQFRNNIPAEFFDKQSERNMQAYATLDHVVIDGPEWWKKLKSALYCPDADLVVELYRGYLQSTSETQRLITISCGRDNGGPGTGKDQNPDVGDGPFSGIAYGPQDTKSDG